MLKGIHERDSRTVTFRWLVINIIIFFLIPLVYLSHNTHMASHFHSTVRMHFK